MCIIFKLQKPKVKGNLERQQRKKFIEEQRQESHFSPRNHALKERKI